MVRCRQGDAFQTCKSARPHSSVLPVSPGRKLLTFVITYLDATNEQRFGLSETFFLLLHKARSQASVAIHVLLLPFLTPKTAPCGSKAIKSLHCT